jgi:hypothetical protein
MKASAIFRALHTLEDVLAEDVEKMCLSPEAHKKVLQSIAELAYEITKDPIYVAVTA